MSWVTVIWSMIASACLTLGAIYGLVWYRNRSAWAYLFFALTAASTAAFTFCELRTARAATPEELLSSMRWTHVALLCLLVSTTWFVTHYLDAGRRWLAWTVTGLRTFYLLVAFLVWGNVNYLEITSLRHEPFLGDSVTVFEGIQNPWMLFGYATMLVLLIFVADASVTAWRRGEVRKALMVGGSVEFFLLLGTFQAALVHWAQLPIPVLISPLYLGLVTVMGYEISHDVIRASQLARDLQATEAGLRESETRMSLAVEAVDFGIWIRDLARNEIWASERWRQLFGFAPLERLEFNTILERLHPEDRDNLVQADANAIAGAGGGKYQTEYRLMLPDGATRWISSQDRVEWDATGQAILIRGTARDVTARKRAEVIARTLSGRLLSAQEEERHRIARELHDNLSQQVAILAIEIGQLAMMSGDPAATAESIRQLCARTGEISKEIHSISHRLHSTKLEALGLQAAVQGHCRELRAKGLQVECRAENVPRALPYELALCLFRIVQEALNNVDKHSGAREAKVTLTGTSDTLLVTIADSGRGFDEAAASVHGGLGLASMRERVQFVGGELTLQSRPGYGTRIIVRAPITEVEQAAAGAPA
ncbi:MAG TPA: PAS domain-containing protein [Vicinamibacterales bacterium]|nr:PAS domain-containing protein [Vicinamibacterales bacterium]